MSYAGLSPQMLVQDANDHGVTSADVAIDRAAREPKSRACLSCGSTFPSEWAGERVCRRCKSTSAWRMGSSLSDR